MIPQAPILRTTAKLPERAGKPYPASLFKHELCQAVQALCLPEGMAMPTEVRMIIKFPESNVYQTLVKTSSGWKTAREAEA